MYADRQLRDNSHVENKGSWAFTANCSGKIKIKRNRGTAQIIVCQRIEAKACAMQCITALNYVLILSDYEQSVTIITTNMSKYTFKKLPKNA